MNRLGVWSASTLCVIGVTYVVTLAVGFASAGFAKPIVDPVLAVMEILTLSVGAHSCRPDGRGSRVRCAAVQGPQLDRVRVHGADGRVDQQRPLRGANRCSPVCDGKPDLAFDGIRARVAGVGRLLGSFAALRRARVHRRQTGGRGTRWPLRRRDTLLVGVLGPTSGDMRYSSSQSRAMQVFCQRCSCCWRCCFAAPGSRARPRVTEKPPRRHRAGRGAPAQEAPAPSHQSTVYEVPAGRRYNM